jgi:APA family basic amino acid/polyamine antiporter
MPLKQELTFFDTISIIVGSIIGADIYIASAITAGLIGPFSLVIWILAAVVATLIATVFAYCSYYVPRVGGPFAFVSVAFDDFWGFVTGWSLWVAELVSLPVFAIAFVRYLGYYLPLAPPAEILVKGLFIGGLTMVNIIGVRAAGRVNDILTIIKLVPLILLVVLGAIFFVRDPANFFGNYQPLVPLGLGNFGTALVLIFWAYVGFELGTLPAAEVKNPGRTIPVAIILGMLIVTVFYVTTNAVVYGVVNWQVLATTQTPLILAGVALLGSAGALIMTVGALFSVSGSDESGMLGTARLSYAMAIDGLFPRIFAKVHPRYSTPIAALAIQGIIAFFLSLYSSLPSLISFAVFNLAFSFLLTSLALMVLAGSRERRLPGERILPWISVLICCYLLYSTSTGDKIAGVAVILVGIVLYVYFSPKIDIHHLKELFLTEEAIFFRQLERKERFLANFIGLFHELYTAIRGRTGKAG